MKRIVSFLPVLLSCVLLSSCASTPDPGEICTAEWIQPRADRAIKRIEKRVDKSLQALRSAGESWMEGDSPGPIQMYQLSRSFEKLEDELKSGPGTRDLRLIGSSCNDPDFVREQVELLFKRAGVSDFALGWIDRLGWLERVLEQGRNSDPSETAS